MNPNETQPGGSTPAACSAASCEWHKDEMPIPMSDDCNESAEVNGAEPFAEACGSAAEERPRPTIEELERILASNEPLRIALQPDGSIRAVPIELSKNQEATVKLWASDDRLWTTQETVEFNLRTFARAILRDEPPNDKLTDRREDNL